MCGQSVHFGGCIVYHREPAVHLLGAKYGLNLFTYIKLTSNSHVVFCVRCTGFATNITLSGEFSNIKILTGRLLGNGRLFFQTGDL